VLCFFSPRDDRFSLPAASGSNVIHDMRFRAGNVQSVEGAIRIGFVFDLEQREIVHRVIDYDTRPEINGLAGNLYPNFLGTLYNVMVGNVMVGDDVT
jgi:hypothetical protein